METVALISIVFGISTIIGATCGFYAGYTTGRDETSRAYNQQLTRILNKTQGDNRA